MFNFNELSLMAPMFGCKAEDIIIIDEPLKFYQTIKEKILNAKHKITLASLYIGNEEHELISTLNKALSNNPNLELNILLDGLRGTRPSKDQSSSASLLSPLIKQFGERVKVNMYHTPDLTGWAKKLMPRRYDETVGLMHIKAYVFDDDTILSGANLSKDYFTNRQDRYYLFNNNLSISTYYHLLISTISNFSFQLTTGLPNLKCIDFPDPIYDPNNFRSFATSKIIEFLKDISLPFSLSNLNQNDTIIFPTLQMLPLNIDQDMKVLNYLLTRMDKVGRMKRDDNTRFEMLISTGYFNLDDQLRKKVIETSARFKFITAGPKANGFYYGKGVSNYIPDAYTLIEHQFLTKVKQSRKDRTIKIYEYERENWTYHAKGLYLYLPNEELPSMTSIGSPNFGFRSMNRDLEAQALIVTSNNDLQNRIHKELQSFLTHSQPIDQASLESDHRRPRTFAKFATPFLKSMF